MVSLEGRVAIVTGAGRGLGRSHALALAQAGAAVLVNDLHEGPAEEVAAEIQAAGGKSATHAGDVSDWEGAEALVQAAQDRLGRLDVLVNNAGILRDRTLKKLSKKEWDQVLQVHLTGTLACSRVAALAFATQGDGGRIINTTSISGMRGQFGQSNYAAAKAGIYALTRTHALELARDKVTVNAVAPIAKTAMTADLDRVPEAHRPELISPLVVWLASEGAADTTGRIFGAHGSHYFEYHVLSSAGVDKAGEAWTPEEVGERLNEISDLESS